jgi:hypothetical protein
MFSNITTESGGVTKLFYLRVKPFYSMLPLMKIFTQEQAIAFLRKRQGQLTLGKFAEQMGVSAQLIGDVYRRKVLPCKKLGFAKIVESFRYKRING